MLTGEQAVIGSAKRIDVATCVERLGLALLRAHEERRADDEPGLCQSAVGVGGPLGQAEIHDLHGAVGGAQEVRGLDVAMDESGRVRCRNAFASVDHRPRRVEHAKRATLFQPVP